jgi:uncharacterized membrane protein
MSKHSEAEETCLICKKQKRKSELLPGILVRDAVAERIREEYPEWSDESYICIADLNRFRQHHLQNSLAREKGQLSDLELQVIKSVGGQELLAKNLNSEYAEHTTLGQRWADKIAEFGGSWKFIIIFLVVMGSWVGLNSVELFWRPFDAYPYILLNLILSCLAAIQAPIIMMSQNRQESKDRRRAEHDYQVNLKAELEIRLLQQKIDHYLAHQWQRLLEIQKIQMEMMEKILRKS